MVRILCVRPKWMTVIKTIKVGDRYRRLKENKKVLVKVIKRMNQNFLAATNNNNEIKIWNLKDDMIYDSGREYDSDEPTIPFKTIMCHTDRITSLQVMNNGYGPKENLVSSSMDKTLRIWIVPEFTEVKRISCWLPIKDFVFAKFSNLQHIYTIHDKGLILLWSEYTELLMDELHYIGIEKKIIIDHNPNQLILPLEILDLIRSFMGDSNSY